MVRTIEEKYYFVTYGLTSGKPKICSKEDIKIRYALALFFLGLLLLYVLLKGLSSEALWFVVIMLAVLLPMFYLSFLSGRSGAKKYIEERRSELSVERH